MVLSSAVLQRRSVEILSDVGGGAQTAHECRSGASGDLVALSKEGESVRNHIQSCAFKGTVKAYLCNNGTLACVSGASRLEGHSPVKAFLLCNGWALRR